MPSELTFTVFRVVIARTSIVEITSPTILYSAAEKHQSPQFLFKISDMGIFLLHFLIHFLYHISQSLVVAGKLMTFAEIS